jgi:hypothetical protein
VAKSLKHKDIGAPPTPSKKRAVPLRSLLDVQRYLARLVNEMRRGEIKPGEATAQTYVLNTLIRTYELTEIKEKILEMERRLGL